MDKPTELKFYRRNDIPLAQELVSNNIQDIEQRLQDLIKKLNPELESPELEIAAHRLAYYEDFLIFYYYLHFEQPGMALHYFKHNMWITKGVVNLLALVLREIPPEIAKGSVNVSIDKYENLFLTTWEMLVNALEPEIDTDIALKQRTIIEEYELVRSNIRGSDYVESDLLELDGVVLNYMNNDITLEQAISAIDQLSIRPNPFVGYFLSYIKGINQLKNTPPLEVLPAEVKRVTTMIKEDNVSKEFFTFKNTSLEAAIKFLDFYVQDFRNSGIINIEHLALTFDRIEFEFRNGVDFDDTPTAKIRALKFGNLLKEASKQFPELLALDQFIDILLTAENDWGYDVEKMKDPTLDEPVKGACAFVLIAKASAHRLHSHKVESYKPYIEDMSINVTDILGVLKNVTNPRIKFRAAQRIVNMLAVDLIYSDILKEFLDENLKGLIHNNIAGFKNAIGYYTLE